MKGKISIFAIGMLLFSALLTNAYAFDVKSGAAVMSSATNVLGGGSTSTKKVDITNSKITNNVSAKNSLVVGNSGISLKGEKIKVSNSKIKNTVKVKNSAVLGNSGISIGN